MTTATASCTHEMNASPVTDAVPASASEALLHTVVLDQRERRRLARRKHLLIALEVNARAPLRALAEEVQAPISTVFDDLKALRRDHMFVLLSREPAAPASLAGLPKNWQRIQLRRRERHDRIVAALRQDARASLTRLSRQLGIPLSTLAEDMADITKRFAFSVEAKGSMSGTGATVAGADAP